MGHGSQYSRFERVRMRLFDRIKRGDQNRQIPQKSSLFCSVDSCSGGALLPFSGGALATVVGPGPECLVAVVVVRCPGSTKLGESRAILCAKPWQHPVTE